MDAGRDATHTSGLRSRTTHADANVEAAEKLTAVEPLPCSMAFQPFASRALHLALHHRVYDSRTSVIRRHAKGNGTRE